MKIYLATGNMNKKREIQQIFPQHTIVTPKDEGLPFDPEETGVTFYENSLIKAQALWNLVHCPVIADDSGICVDALNGVPGIYSSRYGGPAYPQGKPDGSKTPQDEQNCMLIDQLNKAIADGIDIEEGKKHGKFTFGPRTAHYTCAMVLYQGPDRLYVAEDIMEGTLVESIEDAHGTGGFGYDPIFFLPQYQKTAAELTADQKNAISHRGKASRALKALVDAMKND